MHYVVLERLSQRDSVLHRRDARAKIVATLSLLVALAFLPNSAWLQFGSMALLLMAATSMADLPVRILALRILVVLPFSGLAALASWLAGDPARGVAILVKSCLSVYLVILLVATTRMPELLQALKQLGVPDAMVLGLQFVYRYLFVISEQAQHMVFAARSRMGWQEGPSVRLKPHSLGLRTAAGLVAVLFLRSYERSDRVFQAMLARGFRPGQLVAKPSKLAAPDILFSGSAVSFAALLVATAKFGV